MGMVEGIVTMMGLAVWAGSAAAAPGLIVVSTDALAHPADSSARLAQFDAGYSVCVVDDASVEHEPGWTAIQLSHGLVGYIPAHAVDLAQVAPDDPVCGAPSRPARIAAPAAAVAVDAEEPPPPPAALAAVPAPLPVVVDEPVEAPAPVEVPSPPPLEPLLPTASCRSTPRARCSAWASAKRGCATQWPSPTASTRPASTSNSPAA